MKIDFSEIIKANDSKKDISLEMEAVKVNNVTSSVIFKDTIKLDGKLVNIGGSLELYLDIKSRYVVECDRCTKSIERELDFSIEEKLTNDENNEDESKIFFSGHSIEIDEMITGEIISRIPLKHICNEDCKGLCPMCGMDLNKGTCNCESDDIDPRLAGLKDLLKKDWK